MKTIAVQLIAAKNTVDSTSAWLRLLDAVINSTTTLHLVPNPASVVFDGTTYQPFPFQVNEVKTDSRGGLSDVEVSLSNVTRDIGAYVEANDLRGQRVRYRGVHSANLDPASKTAFDEEYEITQIRVTDQAVVVTLGHERQLSHRFPGARFLRDNCRWRYKSSDCGYVGALASCDKILEGANGCRAHANHARFGGFPGLPAIAGRT